MSWKYKVREKVERDWNYNQTAVLGAIFLSVALPLAWGWTSNDEIGWKGYAKFAVVSVLGISFVGEAIRRYCNRSFGEIVCKWIWQK
jgi:hypothetical protein